MRAAWDLVSPHTALRAAIWSAPSTEGREEEHLRDLFGERVEWRTLERDVLEVTAFERPGDYGEHFKAKYGPTIAARANAEKDGREAELDEALDRFCEEWNLGTPEQARFEQEYLLAIGRRA